MTKTPKIESAVPELAPKDTFRILIMDTIDHVNQLKKACKAAGHSVVPAHTIKEAFAFLDTKNHADVIICAAYLEDESMFEFLRRLRSNSTHKDSMFAILALEPGIAGIKTNLSTEKAGRLLGADAFINMPRFDAAQLVSEIQKLLPLVPLLEADKRLDKVKKERPENVDT